MQVEQVVATEENDQVVIAQGEKLLSEEVGKSERTGYDPKDFECVTFVSEENCTHEFVAPSGYQRPSDFRRPKVKPKQYKFTLDKF